MRDSTDDILGLDKSSNCGSQADFNQDDGLNNDCENRENHLATFSLSMSDVESVYTNDGRSSRASITMMDFESENEESDESETMSSWRKAFEQRNLRLSLILGISADEKSEKQLANAARYPDVEDNEVRGSFHSDQEFDFLKSNPIRRCTSLKTNKTPPGTPHKKKEVRFADALGLDLESIRHILNIDEPPVVPDSAMKDLDLRDKSVDSFALPAPKMVQVKHLCTCFSQPGCSPDFLRRVQERKVSLETCSVDDTRLCVTGIVRVMNIDFHKVVVVRQTVNGWITHDNEPATYVSGSNDGATDRFSFTIHLPEYFGFGSRLEFSIMYSAADQEFWDNNYGSNYRVECYISTEPAYKQELLRTRFY